MGRHNTEGQPRRPQGIWTIAPPDFFFFWGGEEARTATGNDISSQVYSVEVGNEYRMLGHYFNFKFEFSKFELSKFG